MGQCQEEYGVSQEETVRLSNIVAAMTTMIVALKRQLELHEQSVGRSSTHLVHESTTTREQDKKRTRQEDNKTRRQQDKKTTRQEDNKTRRQQDKKTTRQDDNKTRRQQD